MDRTMSSFGNVDLESWGSADAISLYLTRCQVETPPDLIAQVWAYVAAARPRIASVLDFGAGDGRFATGGKYKKYVGYEVDPKRWKAAQLPPNAKLIHRCCFSGRPGKADVCIGNPPYVRNQDLPQGWRETAAEIVRRRTGVQLSGLANAWQYFLFLALASTKDNGLVALVIPYEWVSRPSSAAARAYIREHGWNVSVYRLPERSFGGVLTTASITIIDKRGTQGEWTYHNVANGRVRRLRFPSGGRGKVLDYHRRRAATFKIRAKRGLSPGTQDVFVLTEPERASLGLKINRDVVPCVTSLRSVPESCATLSRAAFEKYFRQAGRKCWLINVANEPSFELRAYLDNVQKSARDTATCNARDVWWKFLLPEKPAVLVATGFRGKTVKAVVNAYGARAVGSVSGIHGVAETQAPLLARSLRQYEVGSKVVAHSNGLRKLEINQINSILTAIGFT